ncbi:MAG: hypothetical protein VXZ82_21330 [Planctomycetota bacterium]|nr:hypothetical protein [Planctomycetota bacterium]
MGMLFEWLKYPMPLKAWMGFIVLFPFYFFRSGLPQIADWLLAALIVYELTSQKQNLPKRIQTVINPLRLFALYVCIVSLCWMPFIEAPSSRTYLLFIFPMFYVYNAMAFWLAMRFYHRYMALFLRGTLVAITCSVLCQLVLMPVAPSSGVRGTLFFNNPNQLGYFSLIALSMFLYIERFTATSMLIKAAFFVGTCLFASISNSKAALVSSVILIAINLVDSGAVRFKHFVGGLFAIGLVVLIVTKTDFGQEFYERAINRVSGIGTDSDDNLSGRGYDRIWMHPHYNIVGAGEGGWERFYRDPKRRYEMHSTFGTILFSYGIPGSFLFCLFVYRVFKGTSPISLCYAVPMFAYGATHMGLRFTLFWVFFALVFATRDFEELRKKSIQLAKTKRLSVQQRPRQLPPRQGLPAN